MSFPPFPGNGCIRQRAFLSLRSPRHTKEIPHFPGNELILPSQITMWNKAALCVFVAQCALAQCAYKIKAPLRSDVAPLAAVLAVGWVHPLQLSAVCMQTAHWHFSQHTEATTAVSTDYTNLGLHPACVSIYLANMWLWKPDLDGVFHSALPRGSSGFLCSNLDQHCCPTAKQRSTSSEEQKADFRRVLSTCLTEPVQWLFFSSTILIRIWTRW